MEEEKKAKLRVKMREHDPLTRITNFDEVSYGYSPEEAVEEASRCLGCKKPTCRQCCPVWVDIPGFISLIKKRKFLEAYYKVLETNILPAVTGRVCPQELLCESGCIMGKKAEPIAIGNLQRFVSDYAAEKGEIMLPEKQGHTGRKIAIIGSGPSGLACAFDLTKAGHQVTVFEALHKPGGALFYGIPEYRLPKAIVEREVEYIRKFGVKIELNAVIGEPYTIDRLLNDLGYDTCYMGIGAGLPLSMRIPGENLNGVYSASEFLTRANLPEYDKPMKRGSKVAVFGGGNVAMDSARVALRLGAEKVYLIYRRSEAEMPARKIEVHDAKEEGIEFLLLTNPVRLIDDGKGNVCAVECVKMELGEPDESGRCRPIPIKGSEFQIEIDIAISAIGTTANHLLKTIPDLKLNKRGYILAEEGTGMTSKRGVFAGGDVVTGPATVILAMGAGKKAAKAIHEYLKWKYWDTRSIHQ